MAGFVTIEKGLGPEGRIAVVRFDRGDGINALSPEALRQLTDAARSCRWPISTSSRTIRTGRRGAAARQELLRRDLGADHKDLVAAGYRVIAPDQIGFCKWSKPAAYQFTFKQLAGNTHELLAKLGVEKPVVVGHSTGGMLAAHYALIYPKEVSHLVLVNPVGLEDWSAKGVPPISVDQWYARELKTSADGIRAYEKSTYYAGKWEDRYERAVDMLAGLNNGPGKEAVAWDSALIYDMIITEPVVYRFGEIAVPTLLMIGQKDTTAIAKDFAPPELRPKLGNYPELGKAAAKAIPGARLVEFPEFGHAPQMTDPEGFDKALIAGIAKP